MADWTPVVADVAALLIARTKPTDAQTPAGTFNTNTRPTAAQVEELIDKAVAEVESRTGTVPTAYEPQAINTAAIYAAMLVELSYFPEQIESDQSPYDRLKELFDAALAGLLTAIRGNSPRLGLYSIPLTTPEVSDSSPVP